MKDIQTLIDRIRRFVARPDQSRWAFAKRANLGENTLLGCDKPDWNPRATTIAKAIAMIEKIEAEEGRRSKRAPKRVAARAAASA